MAVIGFSTGDGWIVARWAFRQFLEDIIAVYPEDSEMKDEINKALAFDGLHLDLMDILLVRKFIKAIKNVATKILQGSYDVRLRKNSIDDEGLRMYTNSMNELLEYIKKEELRRERKAKGTPVRK